MKTVLNMSHPLSDPAKQEIAEEIGEFEEIIIPVQINFDAEIKPQLDELASQMPRFDYFVPPALSYVAAYIGGLCGQAISDAVPPMPAPMIVLKREGLPPKFVLAEIVW